MAENFESCNHQLITREVYISGKAKMSKKHDKKTPNNDSNRKPAAGRFLFLSSCIARSLYAAKNRGIHSYLNSSQLTFSTRTP